jgi:predicted  nucleic acid-binding Zn-ribbon protein
LGNQIELLVNLQTIDLQLRERTDAIDALRRDIAELEGTLAAQRQALDAVRAERADLEARRRDIEGTLADEEAKMKDRRMRLNRIRNEKEASAVRREIEVAKEGTGQLEEGLMGLFEQLDGVKARETELATAYEALEGRHASESERIDLEIGELSAGLDEARTQRESLAAGLELAVRRQYETILSRKRGQAVVEVRGGTCDGCHMRIAPQLAIEIYRNARVITCPSCHRILYVRPPEAAGADGADQ